MGLGRDTYRRTPILRQLGMCSTTSGISLLELRSPGLFRPRCRVSAASVGCADLALGDSAATPRFASTWRQHSLGSYPQSPAFVRLGREFEVVGIPERLPGVAGRLCRVPKARAAK